LLKCADERNVCVTKVYKVYGKMYQNHVDESYAVELVVGRHPEFPGSTMYCLSCISSQPWVINVNCTIMSNVRKELLPLLAANKSWQRHRNYSMILAVNITNNLHIKKRGSAVPKLFCRTNINCSILAVSIIPVCGVVNIAIVVTFTHL
jgi:hypothetical protein